MGHTWAIQIGQGVTQLRVVIVLSLGLGSMISSPQHLRLQSIEVGSKVCLVHLDKVKGLVKISLECTGRRGTRGLMLMM
jgi:hypothetical protein